MAAPPRSRAALLVAVPVAGGSSYSAVVLLFNKRNALEFIIYPVIV